MAGTVARCTGPEGTGHAEIVIPVSFGRVSVCPTCGRRFLREEPPRIDPAFWPRDE